MTDLTAVNRWTARLWAVTADVDLSAHQTPTDMERIREQALSGTTGPIVPDYLPVPAEVRDRLAALEAELAEAEGDLIDLVRDSLAATLGFARALSLRTPEAVTDHGRREHGVPDPDLLDAASALLGSTAAAADPDPSTLIPAARAAGLVEAALAGLGVQGWTVDVRAHMSARLSVSAQARQVRIHADAAFTGTQLRGLVVHEVGTHVLRADEGARQPLDLLARGLPGYLGTEEGLATHHELQVAPAADRQRTFALRVVAADVALTGGLADVMDRLTAHVPPATAFPIALRAKRGLADLSQPGSPLKDVVYLRGLRDVGAHLAAHPDDHGLLMAGKLGLPHLSMARSLAAQGLLALPVPRVADLIEQAREPRPPWDPDGLLADAG